MKPGSKEANAAIVKHMHAIAKLNDDDIVIYMGIGAHGRGIGEEGSPYTIDWKAAGPSIATTALGDKLISIAIPLINDFMENDFLQWLADNQELFNETTKDISERPQA